MQLQPVFDIDLAYTTPFLLVQPFGGEDGWGYGEGEGTVRSSEGTEGRVRWVNHPRRRGDGSMLPDTAGHIEMDGGARLLFRFGGRTVWSQDRTRGGQLLWVEFLTDAEPYLWLNDALCVLEGAIDPERLVMRAKVYACRNELL